MKKKILLLLAVLLTSLVSFGQVKQPTVPIIKSPFQTKKVQQTKGIITPSSNLTAKQQQPSKKIKIVNGSFMLNFDNENNLSAKGINAKGSKQKLAEQFNDWFGIKKEHSFQLMSEKTDNYNTTHYNYQQQYKGFKVYGGSVLLHYKNGNAYAVNGKIAEFDNLDTSIVLTEAQALNKAKAYKKVTELIKEYPIEKVIYKISSENEANYTLAYKVRIDAYQPFVMANVFVDAKTGKVINEINLVAHADVPGTAQTLYSGSQNIICDSYSGSYRLRESGRNIETYNATNAIGLTTAGFTGSTDFTSPSSSWTGVPKLSSFTISTVAQSWWHTVFADATPDLYIKIKDGSNQTVYTSDNYDNINPSVTFPNLNILLTNPPYTAEIWDYDSANSDDFGGSYSISTSSGTQSWSGSGNNGTYLISVHGNPALDVHWGMEETYDFYLNVFSRNSYDGNGSVIKQYLNPPPTVDPRLGALPNNAFAAPPPYNLMVYGMGDGIKNSPLVGLDVEGHEFTHMVVNNNGNGGLTYQGESGALNESFADIFGTCVEFYSGVNPDWNIGEDVVIGKPYMRSMSNPSSNSLVFTFNGNTEDNRQPDTYNGTFWVNPNSSYDNGGVHVNSGVQNLWFYLLSQGGSGTNDIGNSYSVTGIGIADARKIAYKNLVTYLTPNATYIDAYNGALQSAEDLFGNPSTQYTSVRQAWYAVGIGNDPNNYCSGTTNLTAPSGTVTDGSGTASYNNNANCKWVIAPTGATQITLNFTEFNTEADYDIVTVYDGPDDTYPVLATWWGNTLPTTITTTDGVGAMCVKFTSDTLENFSGWSANYTATVVPATCGGLTTLTNGSDSFNDGSGIDNYINNQQCAWYIAPPCASSVTLSFTEFDTELNFDGIVVYDDLSGTNILGSFSGNTIPSNITSNTGEMLVVFVSDYSTSLGGFNASYTSTGTSNYSLADTVLNISDYGEISDGSSATDYCNNTSSSWLIQPPQATSITLDFTEFDLEEASSDGSAIYDYVTVYDGIDSSSPVLGKFSGSSLPPNLTSTNGSMFITFNSDTSNTFQGWQAFYTSVQAPICNNETLTADNGTLSDGSGIENYINNSRCSWLIQPSSGNTINLTFSEFDTELDYDGVIVFDGMDENAPVLGVFSGNTLPELITSSGNSMFILFVSDEALRMDGWSATYDTNTLGLENEVLGNDIKLYPNPTNSIINFDNSQTKFKTLEIYNVLGQSLLKINLDNSNQSNINISEFDSGVYTFKFMKQGMFKTIKVIKN